MEIIECRMCRAMFITNSACDNDEITMGRFWYCPYCTDRMRTGFDVLIKFEPAARGDEEYED